MENGPSNPTLWLNRDAGTLELVTIGLTGSSNFNIVLNTYINTTHLEPSVMEKAYRAMIYNQPNFRAKIVHDGNGAVSFCPSTDFSDVFNFVDQSKDENGRGYAGCWDLAEAIANEEYIFQSDIPLHKCYLIKRPDGYNLLLKMHHSIADGTSSLRVLNEVLRQYDRLISGNDADLCPAKVQPSGDQLSAQVKNDDLTKKIVDFRVTRAGEQKILLPLNMNEFSNKNRTLHALGTADGFSKMKELCKELGVTIGSYSFAVLTLAHWLKPLSTLEGMIIRYQRVVSRKYTWIF